MTMMRNSSRVGVDASGVDYITGARLGKSHHHLRPSTPLFSAFHRQRFSTTKSYPLFKHGTFHPPPSSRRLKVAFEQVKL
jgi:hypothetical protein